MGRTTRLAFYTKFLFPERKETRETSTVVKLYFLLQL